MYIRLKEALSLFKKNTDQNITRSGLYFIGGKKGFLKKEGFHVLFDKEKLIEYIKTIKAKRPKGFYTVEELAEQSGLSKAYIRILLRQFKIDSVKIGRKKGFLYNGKQFFQRRENK